MGSCSTLSHVTGLVLTELSRDVFGTEATGGESGQHAILGSQTLEFFGPSTMCPYIHAQHRLGSEKKRSSKRESEKKQGRSLFSCFAEGFFLAFEKS